MTDKQPQTATSLAIAQAMTDELTDYLTGGQVYRQMLVEAPDGPQQPVMTLGALLENVDLLRRAPDGLDPQQRQQLGDIQQGIDRARRAFEQQWRTMLQRELKALLDSWTWYLDDLERDPTGGENYGSEVHKRTRSDLLVRVLHNDPEAAGSPLFTSELSRLAALDERLRALLRGDEYVGPVGRQGDFPRERAWWLYGRPGRMHK